MVQSVCTQTLYKLDHHRVKSSQLKCIEGRLVQRPNHLDLEMTSWRLSFVLGKRTECVRCTLIPERESPWLLRKSSPKRSERLKNGRDVRLSEKESRLSERESQTDQQTVR